ncbi:TPA: hypothetical protein ACPWJ6_004244 [Pseudomonas aeruginosa]
MTDTNRLKDLLGTCSMCGGKGYYCEHSTVETCWCVKPLPKAEKISDLKEELQRLRTRLEISDKHPYDGISCRDETIKALDEKCDKIKAENDALRGALQAVVDDPTWRSNDNTLWPKIIKALDKGATK